MSMVGNLRRVSDGEIQLLLAKPKHITEFLYGQAAAELADRPGFFGRWFGKTSSEPPPVWSPRSDADEVYLDKAWQGIHYLLTGTAWEGDAPANFLVAGGHSIGAVDVGYGPARALTSDKVRELSRYLDQTGAAELRARYDPDEMSELEIYPEIWDEEESLGYLIENYQTLQDFVRSAVALGQGLIIYIN